MKQKGLIWSIITLFLVAISCTSFSKKNENYVANDSNDSTLVISDLLQTTWIGEMTRSEGRKLVDHTEVYLVFTTPEDGLYEIKYKDQPELKKGDFKYSIEGKTVHIKENDLLCGKWLLIEKVDKNIVLQRKVPNKDSYNRSTLSIRKHSEWSYGEDGVSGTVFEPYIFK